MAFAVLAEDYAGDCRDLRAFEEYVGGRAAVGVYARNVGEGVEGSGGRVARQSQLVKPGDEQVSRSEEHTSVPTR